MPLQYTMYVFVELTTWGHCVPNIVIAHKSALSLGFKQVCLPCQGMMCLKSDGRSKYGLGCTLNLIAYREVPDHPSADASTGCGCKQPPSLSSLLVSHILQT